MESRTGEAGRRSGRTGGADVGRRVDLLADDRRGARRPLGPRLGGLRRRSLRQRRLRSGGGRRLPGRQPRRLPPRGRLPQAFRRLRRLGGRPRLRLHRNLASDALGHLHTALPGGHRGRSRYGDELLQRHQRNARHGQPLHPDRGAQGALGARRIRRLGLGRHRAAALAGRGRRPEGGRRKGLQRGCRNGHDEPLFRRRNSTRPCGAFCG